MWVVFLQCRFKKFQRLSKMSFFVLWLSMLCQRSEMWEKLLWCLILQGYKGTFHALLTWYLCLLAFYLTYWIFLSYEFCHYCHLLFERHLGGNSENRNNCQKSMGREREREIESLMVNTEFHYLISVISLLVILSG